MRVYVSAHVCMHMWACAGALSMRRPYEGFYFPAALAVGDCEPPDMGAGNGAWSSTTTESTLNHRVTSPALKKERKCCMQNYLIVNSFQYQLSF